MPDDKNFFAGLVDFSFQQQLARRIVKVLYLIGILGGGITFVVYVVRGSEISAADGLINFGVGILTFFVCVLALRVLLELTLVIMRISDGIERATHSGN